MTTDVMADRIARIAQVPPELLEYQKWLDAERQDRTGPRDYLFAEPRPRLEPRQDDVAVVLPGLQVRERRQEVRLRSERPPVDIELPGVKRQQAQKLLAALDGQRCLLEARWHAGVDQATLGRFLRATFGLVVLAPAAVAALEERLSGVEISRFPASPYCVERAYWENMIAVREIFAARSGELQTAADLLELLRQLHVIALMGPELSSFYKPQSPGADRLVAPGALFVAEPRLRPTPQGTLFLSGPRVNVTLLGGEGYHRALCSSLDDPAALEPERSFADGECDWGRFVTARAERDPSFGPWFCPPRPIRQEHWSYLWAALQQAEAAARQGEPAGVVPAVARFHQAFVRLHPFYNANQCLAMNLVNHYLGRSHGAGIPHLILDHLALRLSTRAYEEVFRRAVTAYAHEWADSPARHLATLQERYQRSAQLIGRLAATPEGEHGALIRAEPEAARWALLDG